MLHRWRIHFTQGSRLGRTRRDSIQLRFALLHLSRREQQTGEENFLRV